NGLRFDSRARPAKSSLLRASGGKEAVMATYRIFFRNSSGIVGRHDCTADYDEAALAVAEVLCDACSDRCDSFGLWIGDHCIAEERPRPLTVDAIIENRQAAVIEHEEAVQRSQWSISNSERLLARIAELGAQSRALAQTGSQ